MGITPQPLETLFTNYRMRSLHPQPSFGKNLAAALNWGEGQSRLRVRTSIEQLPVHEVAEASVGDQAAVFFMGHRYQSGAALVPVVGSFAYHNSVEWCVLTNYHETLLLNSHWLRDSSWFTLPAFSAKEFSQKSDILEALSPRGVEDGSLEDIAFEIARPDGQLAPVDEALFERLDFWREEVLRNVEEIEGVDEALHLIFVQLFVLRVVEDRCLAPSIQPLRRVGIESRDLNVQAYLKTVYAEARNKIQAELFSDAALSKIPANLLGRIVGDLYRPNHLPHGTTYNFSWIDVELLGRAYEKYVSTALVPARNRATQMALWDNPLREIDRVSQRKSYGVYYTPPFVVNHLTSKAIEKYYASVESVEEATSNQSSNNNVRVPRVVDLACGSGSFLAAAADRLIDRLRRLDSGRNWGRYLVENRQLIGVDIDSRAVSLARLTLWLRLTEEPDPLPLPELESIVICGDSLDPATWKNLPTQFDIALGNPPFIALSGVPDKEQLKALFKTAEGRFDYSHLFIEKYVQVLAPKGVLALVVPNRIFRNRDAGVLRGMLACNLAVSEIIDFGSAQVFTGTSAYVALLVAAKEEADRQVIRYVSFRELPERFPGATLSLSTAGKGEVRTTSWRAYDVGAKLGTEPWLFLSPTTRRFRTDLEEASEPLSSFARVWQGIKTGANDLFIVDIVAEAPGHLWEVVNGLGERYFIEREILKPATFGSDIHRYDLVRPQRAVIYPYRRGNKLNERELELELPRAWEYLSTYRELLESRASIRSSGRQWFELVRERDQEWLESRKLIMRDLATEPSFALDDRGAVYLVGGTAVVPLVAADAEILLAYLNSSFSSWYLERMTPSFQSGYRKFEPQHLESLPVPSVLSDEESLRLELLALVGRRLSKGEDGGRVIENEIDSLLAAALGIDLEEVL